MKPGWNGVKQGAEQAEERRQTATMLNPLQTGRIQADSAFEPCGMPP